MDSVVMLGRVLDETKRVVDGVRPDQLDAPTPCEEWTVRDILNHITGGAKMFSLSAEHGSIPDDQMGQIMGGDNLGDDFKASFRAASDHAYEIFSEPGVLDKMVTLPFGEMPAAVALDIAVFDVATHACDIARATGQTIDDTEMLESAIEMGHKMITPDWRRGGLFGDEQQASEGAPASDRLLAFAGRRV